MGAVGSESLGPVVECPLALTVIPVGGRLWGREGLFAVEVTQPIVTAVGNAACDA